MAFFVSGCDPGKVCFHNPLPRRSSKRNYGSGEGFNLVHNQTGGVFTSVRVRFRWFTAAALTAAGVLPVPAQAQVQRSNVRSGGGVSYVRVARPAPRSFVAGPSFHPAPIRSFNRPTVNAARVQNVNGVQQSASIEMEPRPTFRPPQRFVPPNLGNRQSATVSGTPNLNLGTDRITNSNPAPQGTSGNQQLAQTNNSNRISGNNPRNHVFAQRSANWHPDWDHNHDHWWRGHLCHFVNNTWIIFEIGFYPWWSYGYPYDYGYYPYSYGSYGQSPYGYDPYGYSYGNNSGYYTDGQNDGYYDNGQYENQDSTSNSSSDQEIVAEIVAAAQDELSLEGYYHGPIDGLFSPEMHRAVRDFQRDNGLNVTGYLTRETRNALGLEGK